MTGVQTCALPICTPASYTAHFSLWQHPLFLSCPFLVAAAPRFFLPNSCCGSVPVFYTAHFLLRQRPAFNTANFSLRQRHGFLYCQFLVDRKSTRLNSSHQIISYAVFCLKKKKNKTTNTLTTTRHHCRTPTVTTPPTPHTAHDLYNR